VHEVEARHDLVERAVAAAAVVGESSKPSSETENTMLPRRLTVVAERLVDQRGVGEDVEEAVVVLLGQRRTSFLRTSGSPPVSMNRWQPSSWPS
jgi:hypothetical protein